MSMNHRTPPPTPRPLCAIYELQLPLLLLGDLDADETAALQAHLAECKYCQFMLRKYETVQGALTRHFGATAPTPQPLTRSGARARSVSPAAPALLTQEDIMQAANKPPAVVPPPELVSPPTSQPQNLSPTRRRLTALSALAAVLVLTILAVSLFSYFGSRGPTPAATPKPGLDAQSRAYFTVLQTYYTPAEGAHERVSACHSTLASASLWMRNCQSTATPVVAAAQALKGHLTVTPPARWQTADTQIKQATDDTIAGFSAAAAAQTVSEWSTAATQADDAWLEYCTPTQQINSDLLQAGLPLTDLLGCE